MKADVRLVLTADGSHTVLNQELDKTYHSVYGAVQESQRVYVEVGLLPAFEQFPTVDLHIFEMGFGTGLNAMLTAREAEQHQRKVRYTAVEAYPLAEEDALLLNYDELLGTAYLAPIHQSPWNCPVVISPFFTLTKLAGTLQTIQLDAQFHLIYYDAFAPTAQPELWEPAIFEKMANLLLPTGILTTYCSRSYVQRNMRAAGLKVEKHPGPLHKRDILRAIR